MKPKLQTSQRINQISKWNIFSVPMRNPKYNENNEEIIKGI